MIIKEEEIRNIIREIGEDLLAYAKVGPHHPDDAENLIRKILQRVDSKTESTEEVADGYQETLQGDLENIRVLKAMPSSGKGTLYELDPETGVVEEIGECTTEPKPHPNFDREFPEFERRVAQGIGRFLTEVAPFREQTLSDYSKEIRELLAEVPAGGRKDAEFKKRITKVKRNARWVIKWGRTFCYQHQKSYSSELNHFEAMMDDSIAARWHNSNKMEDYEDFPECGYHKVRDRKVYAIKGNLALASGEMKLGQDGYLDDLDLPGYALNCECHLDYIYYPEDLPKAMRGTPSTK